MDKTIVKRALPLALLCMLISVAVLGLLLFLPLSGKAQTLPQQRDFRRTFYSDYARWSAGAQAGISAVWGDFRSLGTDTRIGWTAGLHGGYQFTPTLGLRFSAAYSRNRAGATDKNRNYLLDRDGFTYHGPGQPEGMLAYRDLYSKIYSYNLGLNADVNVNNLLGGNPGSARRWTVLASPGVYANYFRPTVCVENGGGRYTDYTLHYDWSLGLGGSASVVYKASQLVDVALSGSVVWIEHNSFDGVRSATVRKLNGYSSLTASVTFKIGARKRTDHLMYAPTRKWVKAPAPVAPKPEKDTVIIERIVEKPVEKVVTVRVRELPDLPSIHFVRGSAVIDTVKYERELHDIVAGLRSVPKAKAEIWGYADHTGSKRINDRISLARAEALRDYLVGKGIAAKRIVRVRGMGIEPKLEGEAAYSTAARRADIVKP